MSWLMSRLRAGRDQTHHLQRGAQVRRPGWGHHSHGVEGCAGRTGVPPQEWTDPQVTARRFQAAVKSKNYASLFLVLVSSDSAENAIHLCFKCTAESKVHCTQVMGRLHRVRQLTLLMKWHFHFLKVRGVTRHLHREEREHVWICFPARPLRFLLRFWSPYFCLLLRAWTCF